jgi:hypothetical protein
MLGQTENRRPGFREFFKAVVASLKDLRLWLIVLPMFAIWGIAYAYLSPGFAVVISLVTGLFATHLLNKIDALPKPDERPLVNSMLAGTVGALIIPSSDLLVRLWWMKWRWLHPDGAMSTCSPLLTAAALGWLGIFIAPAVTALVTKSRAVFATIVGLVVYIPLSLTDVFVSDHVTQTMSLLSKACGWDTDPIDAATEGFKIGVVAAILTQGLIAIFVSKVISAWIIRKGEATPLGDVTPPVAN